MPRHAIPGALSREEGILPITGGYQMGDGVPSISRGQTVMSKFAQLLRGLVTPRQTRESGAAASHDRPPAFKLLKI